MVVLACQRSEVPSELASARSARNEYDELMAEMQRFRGETYLRDGAITKADLDSEGRHNVSVDYRSWHVLSLNREGNVCGCIRNTTYANDVSFSSLGVSKSALADSDIWNRKLRAAIEHEKRIAKRREAAFYEVGGWAICEDLRRTTEGIRLALAAFALAQILGPAVGIATATVRHHSAGVLRRTGGRSLYVGETELPRYYDPRYGCDMEILRFDSAAPDPRFQPWISQLRTEMSEVDVITARREVRSAAFGPKSAATDAVGQVITTLALQVG